MFTFCRDNKIRSVRRAAAVFLLCLTAAVSLSGCNRPPEITGLPDLSWLPWFSSFDLEGYRVDESLPLYDLTDLVQREGRTLCTAALIPGEENADGKSETMERILLISRDDNGSLIAETLDLSTGETDMLGSFPSSLTESDIVSLRVLHTDPLVMLDEVNGVLYRREIRAEGTQTGFSRDLADEEQDVDFFWTGGELYASGTDGRIWHYDDHLRRSLYWTLPADLTWLIPQASPSAGIRRFMTYRLADRQTACTLELSFPDLKWSLYASDREELPSSAAADDLICVLTAGRRPAVGIYDTAAETRKTLLLPFALQENPDPGTTEYDHLTPVIPGGGLDRTACLLLEEDAAGLPRRLLVWYHPGTASQSWSRTEASLLPYNGLIPSLPESSGVSEELLQQARELEETYDVRILLGNDVPREGFDYRVAACTEAENVASGLAVLEEALSLYPDGFFTALKGDHYREILFLLTGDLTPVNEDQYISNASAFSTTESGLGLVAMNVMMAPERQTLVHEITHIIDYRLLAEDRLDEDAWNAMNPEGFAYYDAYLNEDGESYETADDGRYTALSQGTPSEAKQYKDLYFVDSYSKTWSMEDRARLMEYLVLPEKDPAGSPPAWFKAPHLQEKAAFYLKLLRETFGTAEWPDETVWEQQLREAQ